MTQKGELVALAHALMDAEQMVEEYHGIAADIDRVIMDQSVYPPMWKKGRKDGVSSQEQDA